jgi:hypothetical protein
MRIYSRKTKADSPKVAKLGKERRYSWPQPRTYVAGLGEPPTVKEGPLHIVEEDCDVN